MKSKSEAVGLRSIGLTLLVCGQCSLLQLKQDVDAIEVYSDYLYHSSVTVGLTSFYKRLAHSLIAELALETSMLVVDVGSNDGTGLEPYRKAGLRVAGIEPSSGPARAATAKGIPTVNSFLDDDSVDLVLREHGAASLVCANYVAANVPDPIKFFSLMRSMLTQSGIISIVTGYHPDQFAVNMFEYVNHDHLTYLTVTSAARMAEIAGLRLISAQRVEHKGGSVHLLFCPQNSVVPANESIAQMQQREAWLGVDSPIYFREISERVEILGETLRGLLNQADSSKIVGVGASISTTHLLHQFSIGHLFTNLFDDDPNKVGRYSPGFGIPVKKLDELAIENWQIAVILAWQHSVKLLSRIQESSFRGKVLIPLPQPKILDL